MNRLQLKHVGPLAPVGSSNEIKGRWIVQGGYAAFKRLRTLTDPPTAICCFCDRMAMGVYEAAKETGLHIPSDLSVIGFDNESYTPDMVPPLTTMQLPHAEMGRYAVEKLAEMIAAPRMQHDSHKVKMECEMIVRESVASLKADKNFAANL